MIALLLRLLRVPPEPEPPDGSPESIRIFRAGRNYYRYRLILWALGRLGLVLVAIVNAYTLFDIGHKLPVPLRIVMQTVEVLLLVGLVVFLPVSYLLQRLNYEQRWYIVTDRSLRIRSGIWSVEELTMTFANIQDLRITAGPLQGLLGIADLEVSSAGGGGGGGPNHGHSMDSHSARFAGVDNAEEIRDLIQERLRRYRDTGLGDHDHHEPAAPATAEAAAAELLAEAKALRAALS